MRLTLAALAVLSLAGCTGAPTPATVTAPPAIAVSPDPVRQVPDLILSPPGRGLGLKHAGELTGAQMNAMLGNPSEWPTLIQYAPTMQIADEHIAAQGDATLKTWFAEMKAAGLKFGVETTPFSVGVSTAAAAFARSQAYWRPIARNGGVLTEINLNDPLDIEMRNNPTMTRAAALTEVVSYISSVQALEPGAVVGFTGVYPKDLSTQHIADIQALRAAAAAIGARGPDFYRVDFAWFGMDRGTTPGASFADLKRVSDYCDSIGLPFMVIYTAGGFYDDAVAKSGAPASPADDIYWTQGLDLEASSIAALGWKPKIDVQDWLGAPSEPLPDTAANSFTGSVRTMLSLIQ